jgi:hypothetical protein
MQTPLCALHDRKKDIHKASYETGMLLWIGFGFGDYVADRVFVVCGRQPEDVECDAHDWATVDGSAEGQECRSHQ